MRAAVLLCLLFHQALSLDVHKLFENDCHRSNEKNPLCLSTEMLVDKYSPFTKPFITAWNTFILSWNAFAPMIGTLIVTSPITLGTLALLHFTRPRWQVKP